jgi:predicted XRE-type DNA-binding protein
MKKYTEFKSAEELAKSLGLPKVTGAKIEMRTDLAIAIRRTIEKRELTHAAAAKYAGVGRTVVTAIMNGNMAHISTDRLIDIAQGLGLKVTLKVA